MRLLFVLQDRIIDSNFKDGTLKHGDVVTLSELKSHRSVGPADDGIYLAFWPISTVLGEVGLV